MPEERRLASMHIVDVHGRVHSAGDAVILLLSLSRSRKHRFQALVARLLPPIRRKVHREYQKVADQRGERSAKVDDVDAISRPPRWYRPA